MKGDEVCHNKTVGGQGEDLAADYLRKQRFSILARNFRCKGGEVDIVAKEGRTFVFVEVKTRRNAIYGPPQLAVTPFKQRQIAKAALTWLLKNGQESAPARFDVIAIMLAAGESAKIDHIKNAFDLVY